MYKSTTVITAAVIACLLLFGCDSGPDPDQDSPRRTSDLAADEVVTFFRTAAWLDESSATWHLPIHGWVHEPADSRVRKAAIEKALIESFELPLDEYSDSLFTTRVNALLADSERGKTLVIRLAGKDYELPVSGPNGHVRTTVLLSAELVAGAARDDLLTYDTVTAEPEPRTFTGVITLVGPRGISVVSDIDDTTKVSHVTDRRRLLEHALLLPYEPAAGMSALYQSWSADGAIVHYVSSSPWQLYDGLDAFAERAGFPAASYHMKWVRFRDPSLRNLFRKGTETKPRQIEPLLEAWPQRRFILVGDSGEQDPEVYADLLHAYPGQVERVFIRNVTGASRDDARFRNVFAGIDEQRWELFTEAQSLQLPSSELP